MYFISKFQKYNKIKNKLLGKYKNRFFYFSVPITYLYNVYIIIIYRIILMIKIILWLRTDIQIINRKKYLISYVYNILIFTQINYAIHNIYHISIIFFYLNTV